MSNAEITGARVWDFCTLQDDAHALLQRAAQQLDLSARALHRVLKVARTVADLADAEQIGPAHLAEAFAIPLPGRAIRIFRSRVSILICHCEERQRRGNLVEVEHTSTNRRSYNDEIVSPCSQ